MVYGIILLSTATVSFQSLFAQESKVCFGDNCFYVELAKTQAAQRRGLMFRSQLEENRGMLFLYDDQASRSFWMKNTLIPLDIIWLNSEKTVVAIKENARPCQEGICPQINPDVLAKYVLEVNAKTVEKIGLKVGDAVDFVFSN
ncbi:MAG: DUF192 domain-containing protein [Candidatus Omnitrophica bacterium]|nr:DUF192 domain-containing protein [Candidatus Omnitrophota bacterium]